MCMYGWVLNGLRALHTHSSINVIGGPQRGLRAILLPLWRTFAPEECEEFGDLISWGENAAVSSLYNITMSAVTSCSLHTHTTASYILQLLDVEPGGLKISEPERLLYKMCSVTLLFCLLCTLRTNSKDVCFSVILHGSSCLPLQSYIRAVTHHLSCGWPEMTCRHLSAWLMSTSSYMTIRSCQQTLWGTRPDWNVSDRFMDQFPGSVQKMHLHSTIQS